MARGQRNGALTKEELLTRLRTAYPAATFPATVKLSVLLGHAKYHRLVSDHELDETTPRTETVIPCYLFTWVAEQERREKIQSYVATASRLYRRGTLILNIVSQRSCGSRLPGASDCSVPVWRPRWTRDAGPVVDIKRLVDRLEDSRIEGNVLKHAFLPERWPSAGVPRCEDVEAVLRDADFGAILPPLPDDWKVVMKVTGWDNAVNRMMTKFYGNVKVHAMKGLAESAADFVKCVPLETPEARWLLADAVTRPLCPLIASDDDWAMVMDLRTVLMGKSSQRRDEEGEPTWFVYGYAPKKVAFTSDVLLLHLFLAKYGTKDRSYFPVASRGRKYAYIDAVVARSLFGIKRPAAAKKKKTVSARPGDTAGGDGDDDAEEGAASVSIGQMLGLTPELYNRRRKQLRRDIRKRKREAYQRLSRAESAALRERRKKDRDRWKRTGASSMPKDGRVDSVETDGVGLRMVVKTKVAIEQFVVPVYSSSSEAGPSSAPSQQMKRRRKAASKGGGGADEKDADQPPPSLHSLHPDSGPPIIVGVDEGQAKLFSASISQSAVRRPNTMAFHRRRYYHEIGHMPRRNWELGVMSSSAPLRSAVDRLSLGSTGTCDPGTWHAYLVQESANRTILDAEFIDNIERAKWRMSLHRAKRRSLDGAARRLIRAAVHSTASARLPLDRPLVFGVGDADFAPCAKRGALPAPTAELTKAFKRALDSERTRGRRVEVLSVDEFNTTKCCCACGAVTRPKTVRRRVKDRETGEVAVKDVPSWRLRCCTTCIHTGKIRDRDVQGARNILWLTYALYYGLPRPEYLERKRRQREDDEPDAGVRPS